MANLYQKKFLQASICLLAANIYGQVGINTDTPKATLEVVGKPGITTMADGIIAPKITGNELFLKNNAYGAGQEGTLIYVTSPANGASLSDDTEDVTEKGYYSHNGAKWVRIGSNTAKGLWVNDPANTLAKLNTLSNGTTIRSAGNEFVAKDNGNVGIGTLAPEAKLDVRGKLKLVDGTQGADKVLVSDGNGVASWRSNPLVYKVGSIASSGSVSQLPRASISSTMNLTAGTWIVNAKYTSKNTTNSTYFSWIYIINTATNRIIQSVGTVPETSGERYATPFLQTIITVPQNSSLNVRIDAENACGCAFISSDRGYGYFYAYKID